MERTFKLLKTFINQTSQIMKKRMIFLMAIVLSAISCRSSREPAINIDSVASPKGTEVFQPNWENIAANYKVPDWFRDAKFGIFIHWGVYSVPGTHHEWYSRMMYIKDDPIWKHHREVWGPQDKFGYKDFIPLFKGEKFDADEWIDLFKNAGAKYVVPVAEHHDGFAMYDSDLNEWNAAKMGPKKDIIGLLKAAAEKQGLVFGLSSHRLENAWFYNGGMQFPSDVQDTTITLYGRRYDVEQYTEDLAREWLAHTYELVNKYEPRLIWFDWSVHNPVVMPYFNKFMAYYYNNALDWGEGVVVNTKQGYPTDVQVWDVERGKSGHMMIYPWQTDTNVGIRAWGYNFEEIQKTPEQLVHDLIDIVSKNGNLLLNVGPRPDGTITEGQKEVLLSIGKWLKVNGEAIYGTRCWKKFGEGDAETPKGSFTDNDPTAYTARDIRFTTKGNDFYAIALNWDNKELLVKSLDPKAIGEAKILNVSMLGSDESIEYQITPEGLHLSFPSNRPCDYAYSFKITFDRPVGAHLKSEATNETMKHGLEYD